MDNGQFHSLMNVVDAQTAQLLNTELARQQDTVVLIPSENYASPAVLQALGSVLTNKYAEGYPGKRYYNGCAVMDELESLAIDRVKQLFRAEHANVQPHSGSQANIAAFMALLDPGDRMLAMKLDHGGHLSHGIPQNLSGKLYDVAFYGVDKETGLIDMDQAEDLAKRHQPKLIIVGGSAYPRTIDFQPWRELADRAGAYLLADVAHIAGLIAAGVHPSPVPYADVVTMTTHKTLRGPRGAVILCRSELGQAIDRAIFPGCQGGPFMHAVAGRAVSFQEAIQPEFAAYQRQVVRNAATMAERLVGHGFELITGGTDNHLMLVDMHKRGMSGKKAADRLEEAGIIVNKNSIPFDTRSSVFTSGLRPGSPSVTTRGMREPEIEWIADAMVRAIDGRTGESGRARIRADVKELCDRFPIYPDTSYSA